jgi:GGDEF domain-containing protein
VTESAHEQTPKANSTRRRTRRFVLPETHHDERTDARIEAFVHGSARARQRAAATGGGATQAPHELDTRADWAAAFRHEASRHARYGRPAAVLLLEIGRTPDLRSADTYAHELADMIRSRARSSDRAVRLGPSSFRLLMPETTAQGAREVGSRLEGAFRRAGEGINHRPGLRFDVATPARGSTLEDALSAAERRVAR